MKRSTKIVWGIVLILLSVMSIIGQISENVSAGRMWYVLNETNRISAVIEISLRLAFLIGGIILLLSKTEKTTAAEPENITDVEPENDLSDFDEYFKTKTKPKKKKKNTLCIIAFAASLVVFICTGFVSIPVFPIITALISAVALNQANNNDQKGTGLGKWGLTLSLSTCIALILLPIFGICGIWNPDGSAASTSESVAGSQPYATVVPKTQFIKGSLVPEKNLYVNVSIDLGFIAPENWVMRTKDETNEFFSPNDPDAYEFSAFNAVTREQVYMFTEQIPSRNMTVDQCAESIKNILSNEGMIFEADYGNQTISGAQYKELIFDMITSGIHVKTEMYLRTVDDRIIYIVLQYAEGNRANAAPALNAFTSWYNVYSAMQN